MTRLSKTAFKTDKNTQFAANSTGAIASVNSRSVFENTADSFLSNVDDHQLTTLAVEAAANTYTVDGLITAYVSNFEIMVKFPTANTGSATINVNGIGAKTIKKSGSSNLASGDIAAGQIFLLVYDGTNFQLIGGGGGSGTVTTIDGGTV